MRISEQLWRGRGNNWALPRSRPGVVQSKRDCQGIVSFRLQPLQLLSGIVQYEVLALSQRTTGKSMEIQGRALKHDGPKRSWFDGSVNLHPWTSVFYDGARICMGHGRLIFIAFQSARPSWFASYCFFAKLRLWMRWFRLKEVKDECPSVPCVGGQKMFESKLPCSWHVDFRSDILSESFGYCKMILQTFPEDP